MWKMNLISPFLVSIILKYHHSNGQISFSGSNLLIIVSFGFLFLGNVCVDRVIMKHYLIASLMCWGIPRQI